jgi:hypothetical protein
MNHIRLFLAGLTFAAWWILFVGASAMAQQQQDSTPPDPVMKALTDHFYTLGVSYGDAMESLRNMLMQAARKDADASKALAASESSKKWILDNWVPVAKGDKR